MSGAISDSDRTFLRHFSIMIGSLMLLALVLIALAWHIYASNPRGEDQDFVTQADARIAPVGAVYAGKTGRAKMLAAQQAAAAAAAAQVAYGGTTDGKTIYGKLCHSCHTAGVAGAPKLGDASAWAPRIAEGVQTLIKHAINGYKGPDGNQMPAKGGNPSLTDDQVAATVKWMVSESQ